jgi:hypothetical protein
MMSIRRIRPTSVALFRIRAAALVVVPALAASGLLAIGNPAAYAAPSCGITVIVANINAFTSQAGAANLALGGISFTSDGRQVQTAANSLAGQLNEMASGLATAADGLSGCGALSAADAQTAATAFSNAVSAAGALLSTIGEKHDIFAQFGSTAPIASALRQLEDTFDSYAAALAGVATSQANNITSSQQQADASLGNAISLYEQICIPTPLYPTLKPICVSL